MDDGELIVDECHECTHNL